MPKLILASGSPRRQELLTQLGLEFEVISSDYQEDMSLNLKPTDLAIYLSEGKALSVAKNLQDGIIIAADTFVALDNEILGKPHTPENAKIMLEKISSQKVSVITGLTVFDVGKKKKKSAAVESTIYLKKLSPKEIEAYIKTGEPLDKAGAFGIQGKGALLIKKINGDYNNIVGLPLFKLSQVLKSMGINIL